MRRSPGRPALVLLGGESGVGKTRLIGEFERGSARGRARAPRRGGAAGRRRAALRAAARARCGRWPARAIPRSPSSGRGSERSWRRCCRGSTTAGLAGDALDPSAQLRLFEALLELLDLLSEAAAAGAGPRGPALGRSLDARPSSRFLARSLRQRARAALLTYRTDELHRRHPLRPLLSELERLERARRIELAPFDRDELAEALTDILGDAPSERAGRPALRPQRGQPALHRGAAGRRARRPRRRARRACATRSCCGSSGCRRDAQRAARAIAVGRRLDEETIAEVTGIDRGGAQRGAARGRRRAGAGRRRRRAAALPPRAAARGRCTTTCFPASAASCTSPSPRRSSAHGRRTRAARPSSPRRSPATTRPPAISRPRCARRSQAALAARDVHAYGEAADLAERALELWPRVPGAEQQVAGINRVDAARPGRRRARARRRPRPRRDAAASGARRARPGRRTRARTSALLVPAGADAVGAEPRRRGGRDGPARAGDAPGRARRAASGRCCSPGWPARAFLRGRYRDAVADGEAGAGRGRRGGDQTEAEGDVLNTLGMARIALGDVDEGVAIPARARSRSRARTTTSTASATPTRTWPTCSTSPAARARRWRPRRRAWPRCPGGSAGRASGCC